ncbi:MAG TPA: tetratricopeptide repeat protein, partial [Gemmatimonadales bacterium]|nr:tetratricopeptide repeat protein [Gemmatimonadales bacterium]
GDLVYSYAGGIGTRSGDTADVSRLFLAGLYQQAQRARTAKDSARAATLFAELAKQFPHDTTVQLLAAESLLRDKNDSRGALAALARIPPAPGNRFLASRVAFLKADAYVAGGKPDSARATLEQLRSQFPDMETRIRDRERMISNH